MDSAGFLRARGIKLVLLLEPMRLHCKKLMDLPTLTQASLSLQRAAYNYNANQNIREERRSDEKRAPLSRSRPSREPRKWREESDKWKNYI